MYAQVENSSENKHRRAANSVPKKKSRNLLRLGVVDNRYRNDIHVHTTSLVQLTSTSSTPYEAAYKKLEEKLVRLHDEGLQKLQNGDITYQDFLDLGNEIDPYNAIEVYGQMISQEDRENMEAFLEHIANQAMIFSPEPEHNPDGDGIEEQLAIGDMPHYLGQNEEHQ
ncbi:hypothetical protein L2755_19720 [Shewanella abyssi]|uniref:hypothetical protein n=1 Tax=Shewanella abyssi TaxID=311789 RepID=UPI0020106A5C|nr:hypothetical protein [Shewanella abyssi]MCL1051835.1 hypothetical protein [Shewanella abyssi]